MELRVKCAVCAVAMCLVLRAGSGMEHKFRYYTDNSGLSSNTIQCLYQDDKGYVWVGTADGLDRFNSYDFTNYRSDYRRRNSTHVIPLARTGLSHAHAGGQHNGSDAIKQAREGIEHVEHFAYLDAAQPGHLNAGTDNIQVATEGGIPQDDKHAGGHT